MPTPTEHRRTLDLLGIPRARVFRNLSPSALYEQALERHEGMIADGGPLVCLTGHHTGRSPNDKFIANHPASDPHVAWGGPNRAMSAAHFDALEHDVRASLEGTDLFVQEVYAGADPEHRLAVRVITERAWHSLFTRNLFLGGGWDVEPADLLTIIDSPTFRANPARHGTNSDVVIAVHFPRRLVLIGGTSYAGEIKKSVFSTMNFLLPLAGVLPMHCSANVGAAGDVALFFGLSGTGKTTLSSDPERSLIGDDEHGWSDHGVFNFEGGCYAKTIRLSPDAEPQIYQTTRRFGTVLENVVLDPDTRRLDLDSDRLTENTRAAYPISFIDNAVPSGQGTHPRNILMLTADAFGVLPPISRLSADAAMYHFLSGYTAKVAGTEKGVTEPKATFSTCFGAPFLPLAPGRYAGMLGERIARHRARVWLVNTGWTGGAHGTGRRLPIRYTRAMIRAALSGDFDLGGFERDTRFNLDVPTSCPGVPQEMLNPRSTWADGAAYDSQALRLAQMFKANFTTFEGQVSPAVVAAGPRA